MLEYEETANLDIEQLLWELLSNGEYLAEQETN
jgi:hypothetical protein